MPDPIVHCAEHGSAEGASCPVCDEGRHLLSGERRRRLSKYLSGALRHFPADAGLELDDGGWTGFAALVESAERQYEWTDAEAVAGVIATDPKGRFERDGERVRAAYGHSVDVALDDTDSPIPDTLYHGTAPRNVESILAVGLKPMRRQQVHLSGSVESAREVGNRHADDPVVLEIDATAVIDNGHEITKRGQDVYTTDRVPPAYLHER